MYEKNPFSTAIDWPARNSILFFSPSQLYCYALSYAKKENTLTEGITPAFDIDDGFIPSPYGAFITEEMEHAFQEWKKNDHERPVFVASKDNNLLLRDSQPEVSSKPVNTSPLTRFSLLNSGNQTKFSEKEEIVKERQNDFSFN
ncbi:hypothetical protein [Legionella gresilensis]|uniref:hypothetical protein n=1 Tax=Legionella gresilensis TaxID=91823 RepID=UPI001041620F|nr:hypothetical protein [Legionella gresilensis]